MASPMPVATQSESSFGTRIRHAREARGVSLRQIADTTRISVRALEALERNDVARLPGGIFSRAFVRSYAAEVGIDPEQAVREFLSQFPNELAIGGTVFGATDDSDAHARFGPRAVLVLSTLVFGVAVILIWSFAAH